MFTVVIFIFIGMAMGRMLRGRTAPVVPRLPTMLIWLLLFLLGAEAGANDSVMASLSTLGIEGATIALFATTGSCLAAMCLWHYVRRHSSPAK